VEVAAARDYSIAMVVPVSRLEAVLLAGASGDAIGGAYEGHAADASRTIPSPPWRISDDTVLTLATCRAVAKSQSVDPAAIAEEFVREYHKGVPGVGSSTLKALRDLAAGQHWALAGARGEYAAGNGAAMRIAPLAFFGDARDPSFARTIRDVATITHRNDEAAAGALAVVVTMQLLSEHPESDRHATLRQLTGVLPDTALSDSLASLMTLAIDAPIDVAARQVGTSGRTAQSVALAIFIGATPIGIEDAILAAIRAGGDADTIAAIAAQLRACAGQDVPLPWWPQLPVAETEELTRQLAELARPAPARKPWWKILF
jgi:ADP-ribosylglycohydrolase